MKLSEVTHTNGLYVMLKGEPGTRKSTQALTFPRPQYWFSVDRKMTALRLPMKEFGINGDEIEFDDYINFSSLDAKLERLQEKCPYKTIVLDSVTSIGDITNLQTMRMKSGTTTKDGAEKGNRVGGITVNTLEDYKAEASAFTSIIDKTKDIQKAFKCNIILIAHVVGERLTTNNGVTAHTRIIVTGGKIISGKIPAYCEEIYHFDIEQSINADKPGSYRIFTNTTNEDFARTSLPLAPIINIGNDNLYDKYIKPAITKLDNQQAVKGL